MSDGGRPVAVVTGAASGVGRASALRLAGDGYAVACVDRQAEAVVAVAAEITAAGGTAIAVAGDLARPEAIAAIAATATAWRGRVDVLAHVAGIHLRAHTAETSVEAWDRLHAVNLRAPFLLTQALLESLLAAEGAVVAVSSLAGQQGWPYSAAYSASKGGLVTLMRSLALEFGPRGLRVNVVCPGAVDTPMTAGLPPLEGADPAIAKRGRGLRGTAATPDDVAASVCFLASPAARHVSGAVLTVDGGASA